MTDARKQPAGVVVLGMSRSGTSAVTALFRDAGFYLGPEDRLMGADQYNPLGYNEDLRIFEENERILEQAGGSWFDPPEAEALLSHPHESDAIRSLITRAIEEAAGAPIVVKDPRVGVMMALWAPVIDEFLHAVLVIRDPIEIALSLAHRDGTPELVGVAAWEVHMTALLRGLQGRAVTVVRYAEILAHPDRSPDVVEAAARRLAPQLRERTEPAHAGSGVASDLRRNRVTETDHEQWLTRFQAELWRFLGGLEPGTAVLETPAELRRPSPSARLSVAAETRRLAEMRSGRQRQDELTRSVGQLEAGLAELHAELDSARAVRDRLTGELQATQAVQQQLSAAHQELLRSRDELLAAREDALREISRLNGVVDAVNRSHSWRMTQPLRDIGQVVRDRRQSP